MRGEMITSLQLNTTALELDHRTVKILQTKPLLAISDSHLSAVFTEISKKSNFKNDVISAIVTKVKNVPIHLPDSSKPRF